MSNATGSRRKRKSRKQRTQNLVWMGGVILLLGIALVLPSLFAEGINVDGVHTYQMTNGTSIGDPNAPVHLVEFSDFRCSHCQNFARESEQLLLEEYVYTGLVYYTFRTAGTFLGPESGTASEAAYCADDQGMFWEYRELAFTATQFTHSYLSDIAEALGMDRDEFNTCLSDGGGLERADADYNAALESGVQGTPGFFINGENANSGSNYELLKQAIEAALP